MKISNSIFLLFSAQMSTATAYYSRLHRKGTPLHQYKQNSENSEAAETIQRIFESQLWPQLQTADQDLVQSLPENIYFPKFQSRQNNNRDLAVIYD